MNSLHYFYRQKYRTIFAATKCRHAAQRIWIRSLREREIVKSKSKENHTTVITLLKLHTHTEGPCITRFQTESDTFAGQMDAQPDID